METHPIQKNLLNTLKEIVGDPWLSQRMTDRIAYSRDQWPRSLLRTRQGQLEPLPDLVVWPENTGEVAQILAATRTSSTPLVATGAGSSVTGATVPHRHGVGLDLKRLDKIRWINPQRGLAEIEGGMLGIHLEEALNRAGLTLGHFPSSILCSSFGGWIATRSAGQASSRYGKIEDLVTDIEVAFSDGTHRWLQGNFDLLPLMIGSEGMFGIITAARVRVYPAPQHPTFRGLLFPDVPSGLNAIRKLLQEGGQPPVIIRLYDAIDTLISSHRRADPPDFERDNLQTLAEHMPTVPKGWSNPLHKQLQKTLRGFQKQFLQRALQYTHIAGSWIERLLPTQTLLILGCDGHSQQESLRQMEHSIEICKQEHGKDLGPNPGWHWFTHRYNVSFKQTQVFLTGAFSDTFEVAASWEQLPQLYTEVKQALQQEAFVMAHFSHAYPDGCSIYFSFVSYANEQDELLKYDRIWRAGLAAAARTGATISHHHGVGLGKAPALALELGRPGLKLLSATRAAFAPDAHLNPGKLSLDEGAS